ncbi:flagellar export chaperone FliS [Ideonella sp. A 288]|uniref:flagellar export chaperone FliS n=1 Tax=Ideonella sp. A 288 TaxID=1962181 RepID=UPI000B4BB53D|nr:flagellar export chaperone FliS [Ideonella sp. A 288]
MYSAPFASRMAPHRQPAGVYHQVGVQTAVSGASPHQLVALLFDGYFAAVQRARHAIQQGDTAAKNRAISHAVRIIDEGLKASLNLTAGGKLATDLSDLYAYVCLRLTQANLRNDEKALDECRQLMQPLHEAWSAIGPRHDAANHL